MAPQYQIHASKNHVPNDNTLRLPITTTRRRLTSRRSQARKRHGINHGTRDLPTHGLLHRRVPKSNNRLRNISTRSMRQPLTSNLRAINSRVIRVTLRRRRRQRRARANRRVRRSTRKTRNPFDRQSTINTLNNRRGTHRDRHQNSRTRLRLPKRKPIRRLILLNRVPSMRHQGHSRTLTSTRKSLPNSTSTPTRRRNTRRNPKCM